MQPYFLDTSALIKKYVRWEIGHQWMADICAPERGNVFFIAEITLVETIAALARMPRETPPRLSTTVRDQIVASFRQHVRKQYVFVRQTRALLAEATELCLRYPLRAYDAVQLASAKNIHAKSLSSGLVAPTFVSGDTVLLSIAAAEGFSTENPNNHP